MIEIRRFNGMNLLVHPASQPPDGSFTRLVNADCFVAGAIYPRRGLARPTSFEGLSQQGTTVTSNTVAETFGTPIRTLFPADGRFFARPALEHDG